MERWAEERGTLRWRTKQAIGEYAGFLSNSSFSPLESLK